MRTKRDSLRATENETMASTTKEHRELTADQELRAKPPTSHEREVCRRCGLLATRNHGRCPPGFWMTKTETEAWERGVRYKDV